ncbi:Ionotropic receptor 725 [Blattella germanica]|nr:Ionotropic receptor 725 [Blattella germanica]
MIHLAGVLFMTLLVPAVVTTTLQLSTCLEQILTQKFPNGKVIVISLPSWCPDYEERSLRANSETVSTNYLIAHLSNKMEWPLIISTDSQSIEKDIPDPQHGYVIFLFPDEDIVQSLEIQIEALRTFSYSYNRRGKFIVVVFDEKVQDSHSIAKDLLVTLWAMDNIVNSIVLIQSVENKENLTSSLYNVYTMFTYRSEEECGKSEEVLLIDQWRQDGGFQNGEDLFPPKVPTDFMGCTLTIEYDYNPPFHILSNYTDSEGNIVNEVEGINHELLGFVSQGMNFTLAYVLASTIGYAITHLIEGRQVNMGLYTLTAQVFSFADLSVPYAFLKYEVYVPKSRPNSVSGNFLEVFSNSVWSISLLVILLGALVFRGFQKEDEGLATYQTFSGCLLNTWAVFLSASVDEMPTKTNFRIFFLLFVTFCFAVNTVFQSFFTSFLIEPGFEYQINSIEDLNERHLPVLCVEHQLVLDLYLNWNVYHLFSHQRICENTPRCLEDVYRYRLGATVIEMHESKFHMSVSGVLFNAGEQVHRILTATTSPIAVIFTKGHPLVERFNLFLQRCLESGLPDNYYTHMIRKYALRNRKTDDTEDKSFVVLGLNHLQMGFLFHGIGCALSISLFLFEYLHVQGKRGNKTRDERVKRTKTKVRRNNRRFGWNQSKEKISYGQRQRGAIAIYLP